MEPSKIQSMKWELAPFSKGICIEITDSAIKCYQHHIQVSDLPFNYNGQQIQPDVKVKDLRDLSLFASKQIDAFVIQRPFDQVSPTEITRLLKKGGKLILISQDVEVHTRYKKILDNKDLELIIYELE